RTSGSHIFENFRFVRGVTFDGFHQVRDEISAALQLDGDITPGFIGADIEAHQRVVHEGKKGHKQNNYDDYDNEYGHELLLYFDTFSIASPAETQAQFAMITTCIILR